MDAVRLSIRAKSGSNIFSTFFLERGFWHGLCNIELWMHPVVNAWGDLGGDRPHASMCTFSKLRSRKERTPHEEVLTLFDGRRHDGSFGQREPGCHLPDHGGPSPHELVDPAWHHDHQHAVHDAFHPGGPLRRHSDL